MAVIDNQAVPAAAAPPESVAPGMPDVADEGALQEAAPQASTVERLLQYAVHPNIALDLEDGVLGKLGQLVVREFGIDVTSRSDWEEKQTVAMELAMQVAGEKDFPWPKAANVKYPLLTTAAVQFQARAYPAIVPGREVAKAEVIGKDDAQGTKKKRAKRVGQHLSYQVTKQMKNWEGDTDRMLIVLPIEGTVFRKTYFDSRLGRNASDLVRAMDLVVNYKAKSLEAAPRVTQVFRLYPYEIEERVRSGVYRDAEIGLAAMSEDVDAPHEFLEQHRLYDLDEDGYPEPYICTVHKESAKVVRVVARFDVEGIETDLGSVGETLKAVTNAAAGIEMDPRQAVAMVLPYLRGAQVVRIEPVHYFTKYGFIPNPESAIYDLGFGMLLNPINETVNTVINQLLDAGTMANTSGGFIGSGVRMKSGRLTFQPNEWKRVDSSGLDLKANIVPLPVREPSAVLFQLLGLLIEAGRDIASVKDILTGDQPTANVPATTTLAMIEQGLKVFTAIYKRIHRSLGEELRKLYRLNRLYLQPEEYFRVLDEEVAISLADYNTEDYDVCPFSDPTISTEAQRMARAQAKMGTIQLPWVNAVEVTKDFFESIGEENPERFIAPPPPPGPSPEMLTKIAELELKQRELQLKALETTADIILKLAQAEGAEAGQQFDLYLRYLEAVSRLNGASNAAPANDGGRVRGMVGQPGGGMVPPVPGGGPGGMPAPQGGDPGRGGPGLMGPDEAGAPVAGPV